MELKASHAASVTRLHPSGKYIFLIFNILLIYCIPYENQPKPFVMKKIILILSLAFTMAVQAQTEYWTSYTFVVEPQDVQAVYNLVDSYYKAHKPEGVSVRLFENHFRDHDNNYSHVLVFSGSLDAMGDMYGEGQNESFDLFLSRMNQHLKEGYSASMGRGVAGYMGGAGPFPFRRMFVVKAEDSDAFEAAFQKMNAEHNPDGRMIFLGSITSGRSAAGETHFMIAAFRTFKAALAGVGPLIPANKQDAYDKAWKEFADTNGGVTMISTSMRVLLGEW